ncbi:MAG: segregation/condensation protein A [Nanoarchaeota archaeon]|nr:segregation/condensation protein A [Nanoarchaeota archaeon]
MGNNIANNSNNAVDISKYIESFNKGNFSEKVGQNELYNLLVSRELSWQQIILDLIKSEQLDPWDIDLAVLTKRYLEKIHELEEANFFISSKILLAASILLRIKSEILVDKYIKSLDEILFGIPEKKEKPQIEINLDDVAELFPRTPLPRPRKVTLPELMQALSSAMVTEQRRIRKEITVRHAVNRLETFIPKKSINIRERIKEVYSKILGFFSKNGEESMKFSQLAETKEEKIPSFHSIMHLDFQKSIFLDQPKAFEEIFIYLTKTGMSANDVMKQMDMKEREYVENKMKQIIDDNIRERSEGSEGSDDTIKEYEETEEFKKLHPEKFVENKEAKEEIAHNAEPVNDIYSVDETTEKNSSL